MYKEKTLIEILQSNSHGYYPIVEFDALKDTLILMDFSASNSWLDHNILNDTRLFCAKVEAVLSSANALYGIGGYAELRAVYNQSKVFDAASPHEEPRRLHLGIDIWGKAGTKVYAPLGGMVHSFAFNNHFGDYGATIILSHQLEGVTFYTLYGHLALEDLATLSVGQYINHGVAFAHFGIPEENGHWPPHLHFQIIADMECKEGDYPGVCKNSERNYYLKNCPDPDIILQMMQWAVPMKS